jgi:hypothetical protein
MGRTYGSIWPRERRLICCTSSSTREHVDEDWTSANGSEVNGYDRFCALTEVLNNSTEWVHTIRGKVYAPPWAIYSLCVTCNMQREIRYMTHCMTCCRRCSTCYILYGMHSLCVLSHICAYMCRYIRMYTYSTYIQLVRNLMCFSIVATTEFFIRGPPTWCINLSTYSIHRIWMRWGAEKTGRRAPWFLSWSRGRKGQMDIVVVDVRTL